MRVLLLNPHYDDRPVARDFAAGLGEIRGSTTVLPPMDLLSHASELANKGHHVRLIDQQVCTQGSASLHAALSEHAPDMLLMAVSQPTLDKDILLARAILSSSARRREHATARAGRIRGVHRVHVKPRR